MRNRISSQGKCAKSPEGPRQPARQQRSEHHSPVYDLGISEFRAWFRFRISNFGFTLSVSDLSGSFLTPIYSEKRNSQQPWRSRQRSKKTTMKINIKQGRNAGFSRPASPFRIPQSAFRNRKGF